MSLKNNNIKGAGDLVEIITRKTGIKKVVKEVTKAVGIEDCGCDNRQEKLNVFIPFGNGSKQNK